MVFLGKVYFFEQSVICDVVRACKRFVLLLMIFGILYWRHTYVVGAIPNPAKYFYGSSGICESNTFLYEYKIIEEKKIFLQNKFLEPI